MLGSASLVLGATSLLAQDTSSGLKSGLYLSTDAGLNLADNLTMSEGSISLSPGLRWDVSMGYAFKLSDRFSLDPEMEVGILYNSLDTASAGGQGASVSGSLTQVPVLANAVLNWQFNPHWVAYAGGGAGYDYSSLNVSSVGGIGIGATGSESDFAWQGMAGIRYMFGSSELGLGYKYLAVKLSGLQTVGNNAIMVSYTFHF